MFKSGNQYNMRVAVECVTINPEIKKKKDLKNIKMKSTLFTWL